MNHMDNLADTFKKLANSENWKYWPLGKDYWCHPLIMARLALMVVENHWKIPTTSIDHVLLHFNINPTHYANVKERVEKADTEDKDG